MNVFETNTFETNIFVYANVVPAVQIRRLWKGMIINMKYIIVLGDGMADEPIENLDGKTPLEYAVTPAMDLLSKKAEIGMVHTIPEGMKPGSDTANLAVLG